MSLIYRAIWRDDSDNIVDIARQVLVVWVRRKFADDAVEIPTAGRITATTQQGRLGVESLAELTLTVEQVEADSVTGRCPAIRARLTEARPDGTRWDTILRGWSEGTESGAPGWLWVDVEAVGEGAERAVVASPHLVRGLLISGSHPRRGDIALAPELERFAGDVGGEALAELLSDVERDLPVVVFADALERTAALMTGSFSFDDAVRRTAERVAGIAKVVTADETAARSLTDTLGPNYALDGNGLRIYSAGLDPAVSNDYWRHRKISAERYLRFLDGAAIAVSRIVSPASGVRRPPMSWDASAIALDAVRRGSADVSDLLDQAYDETTRLESQLRSLREELDSRSTDYEFLALDLEESVEVSVQKTADLERLDRLVRTLQARLAAAGVADAYSLETSAVEMPPLSASSLSQAAEQAQLYLTDRLVLPAEALRDLEDLDATVNAASWGQTSWLAFRALHAYASAMAAGEDPGSFWTWCANSGHPLAWRATKKKLAMVESDAVSKKKKGTIYESRFLPISTAVAPDGLMYMESHIKVAEGGGPLAPRIYFHIEHEKSMVHVGFFGPHKYMPNTKT